MHIRLGKFVSRLTNSVEGSAHAGREARSQKRSEPGRGGRASDGPDVLRTALSAVSVAAHFDQGGSEWRT